MTKTIDKLDAMDARPGQYIVCDINETPRHVRDDAPLWSGGHVWRKNGYGDYTLIR